VPSLFVVRPDSRVEPRKIEVGASDRGLAAISKGIAADETVVTDGQLRLTPDTLVHVKPARLEAAPAATMRRRQRLRRDQAAEAAMNLSELCIRRPVMTTLLMAALLIFGVIGYRALPVSELPNVDFPTISVTASLPGASPETMAAAVATPLEGQFSTIAGLDSMTSTSAQGSTAITLQFSLERNIDAAAQDVQSAISAALRRLPPNMPAPPSFRKVNPADSPIFYIAMSSVTLPLSLVNEYAETQLAQRLSTIAGVAQVQVYGSQKFAVRIQANPDQLASRGIGIDELQQALAQNNVNQPVGQLDGQRQSFAIRDGGQLGTAAAYRPLIVAWRNGAPVRLEEVASAIDSVENQRIASWNVDQRAIVLAVQRQPGANTIDTVEAIQRVLPVIPVRTAGSDRHEGALRPQCVDSGSDRRRPVHPDSGRFPGPAGDSAVPAESVGHTDPQPGAADLDRRHLRLDVDPWLQPRQSFPAGPDPVGRLRCR
jgi:hypothetical protein